MASQSSRVLAPALPGSPHPTEQSDNPRPIPRQVLTRDKWDELKPVIRQLYVDEHLPYPKVASILRASYGFLPTKGQFKARVSEWGFKKNTSRSERLNILQSSGVKLNIESHGRAVTHATRMRWAREMKRHPLLDVANARWSAGTRYLLSLKAASYMLNCCAQEDGRTEFLPP
jgi:hypothetical protein